MAFFGFMQLYIERPPLVLHGTRYYFFIENTVRDPRKSVFVLIKHWYALSSVSRPVFKMVWFSLSTNEGDNSSTNACK